jgi:hypothetical protein
MQPKQSERGQALILIVFAIIGLIGMTALAVDGGNAYADRRHAQNAADTAALAGGRAIIRGEPWKPAALAIAGQNGYTDTDASLVSTSTTFNVEAYSCSEAGSDVDCGIYDGDAEYIQVKITSTVDTFFAPIVGIETVTNVVQAIAHVVPGDYVQMFDGHALVGLAPGECSAVTYDGTANTTVTGGGIYVNSSCQPDAFDNQSSSAQLSAPSLCTVGGIDANGAGINIPTQTEGCASVGFPPEGMAMPNPSCGSATATQSGGSMSPGNYSGNFPPAGVTFLESGIYCIDGDFRLNAGDTLAGSNVVIVVTDGDVDWAGGAQVNLSAPESGPFAGLLIYIPMGDPIDYSNTVTVNGNSDSSITGTFLAPASHCKLNGTGGLDEVDGQVICYTMQLSGTTSISVHYNDLQNWDAQEHPVLELAK